MAKWNFLRDYTPGMRMEVYYNVPMCSTSSSQTETLTFRGVTDSGVVLCTNDRGEGVCVNPDNIRKIELRGDFIDYLAPMKNNNAAAFKGNALSGNIIK